MARSLVLYVHGANPLPRSHKHTALPLRWRSDLAAALVRCKESQDERRSIEDSTSLAVLGKARIIGCTTTGAAK